MGPSRVAGDAIRSATELQRQRAITYPNLHFRDYFLAEIRISTLGFRRRNLILMSEKPFLMSQKLIPMSKLVSDINIRRVLLARPAEIRISTLGIS